ncbi:hypothetical protein 162300198 [Organic Lake phycodnavirus 2]|nr:hypothetical protein 162300198 [Organic Lake phycodnavirus 2]
MDDFTSNILNDSKNEWSILLINLITSHIIDGFRSIFNEAIQLCQTNDEPDKYLMTYQNLLSRIPNWNQNIIQVEKDRIIAKSKCSYLEDLITCVHIIQLKLLSCVRVGSENKKINIDIPDFTIFLHKIYINIARKLYSNIYLFEIDIPPLEQQRRNREFEWLVQTSIMNTIRDNLPVENLLRQYIDETQEVDVSKVETVVENKPLPESEKEKVEPVDEIKVYNEPVDEIKVYNEPVDEIKVCVEPVDEIKVCDEPVDEIKVCDELVGSDIIQIEDSSEKQNSIRFHPDITKDDLNIGEEIKINVEDLEKDNIHLDIEEL